MSRKRRSRGDINTSVYTRKFHNYVADFAITYRDHLESLSSSKKELSQDFCLANVAFFIVTHSLLGEHKKLLILVNDLILNRLTIKSCDFGSYVELYERNAQGQINNIAHPHRLFLDATAYLAIHNFKMHQDKWGDLQSLDLYRLWKILKCELPINTAKSIINIKAFCRAGAYFNTESLNPRVPIYLQSYAVGDIESFCTSPESFNKIFNPSEIESPTPFDFDGCFADYAKLNTKPYQRKTSKFGKTRPLQNGRPKKVHRLIKSCLHDKDPNVAMASLKDAKREMHFPHEVIFVDWFKYLLNKGNSVSTLLRYFYSIAEYWLFSLENEFIEDLSPCDMTELRDGILDYRPEEGSSYSYLGDMNKLLIYCAKYHGTSLPNNISLGKSKVTVRNYLLTECDFISGFKQLTDQVAESDPKKLSLGVLYLLMGRCGLRPSEAVKLRLSDIQEGQISYIHIRPNKFGKNKTHCSRRTIPVSLMLKEEELSFFERYLKIRQKHQLAGIQNELFAPPNLNRNNPFTWSELDFYIARLLQKVTNTKLVSYHLRHMAISNLQLAVMGNAEINGTISQTEPEYINFIRQYFRACDKQNYLWQVSAFAGHISPVTTMSVYSHFTDFLLGEHVVNFDVTHNLTFWSNVSGKTKLFLKRRFKKELITGQALLREI